MRVNEIKIFPFFRNNPPKPGKLKRKEEYFRSTGKFESEVVLDGAGNLIDGYTTYLLAKRYGVEHIPVKYGRRQIIRAVHKPGGRMYAWELPGILIDHVEPGDRVLVRTGKGCAAVLVVSVEEYGSLEKEPLRMVIKRCKEGGQHGGRPEN